MAEVLHYEMSPPPPEPGRVRKPWYRRAVVIIPLMVAAIVATIFVVTRDGSEDETRTAPTPAPARVQPAQVRTTVTSALTGEPLVATLELASGARLPADAAGAVADDRVGPGDQVSVGATGYVAVQAMVSPDRTVTATLQPTLATVSTQLTTWAQEKQDDAIINWVYSPATGMQFTLSHAVTSSGENPPWSATRDVVGKNATADVTVFSGMFGEIETADSMFGKKAAQVTIAGQSAWHGPMGHGTFASFWVRQPLMVTVFGSSQSTTDSVLAGIITGQPTQ